MTTQDFFNLFLIASAIFGFIFSIVLFTSKNGRDKSMRFLNYLVLAISLNNLQSWVLAKELFQNKFLLDYIQIPWHFLTAPFFYMFLMHYLEIAEKSVKILRIIIPLFFTAIIAQVYFVLVYSNGFESSELKYIYERYTSIEEIISFIISFGVFGYAFYLLYRKENLFPKILSFDNLKWIYTFFIIGAVGYFLWLVALIIKVNMNFTGFIFSYYPLRIYTTLLIYWIAYQSIIQLNLLKERRTLRTVLASKAYVEKNTTDEDQEEEFLKIDSYIKQNKKFTESKLTRDALALEIGVNKNKLSALINNNTQKTFIEYMNEFKVNYAKNLLLDKEYNQYTITAIGLESGFNSKSTFYYIFKKYTGKTPTQYKYEN